MWVSALNRKLFRELANLKGQIATIALVVASGIASFIALRGDYLSLEQSRIAYYDAFHFAHVFASVERAPEWLVKRIEALPGVATAQSRIAEEVTLPLEGMSRPAYGRLLSLPAGGTAAVNGLCLKAGRLPAHGQREEIVLLAAFAEANSLGPGSSVPVVVNAKLRTLRVVGVAESPEFVYALRPGAIFHDPKRYAVLWMQRDALADDFQFADAFNELSLRLEPGASEAAVLAELDQSLAPYGTNGAVGRKNQLSNRILTSELSQLGMLASMVPSVFLGVAAFLLNLVLARLIRLQRHELATLKALGYTSREIGRHYLALVLVILLPGAALGIAAGTWLGRAVLGLYGQLLRFPALSFDLSFTLIAQALLVNLLAALAGSWLPLRAALKLPAAEAMRPPSPASYRKRYWERLGLPALIGTSAMMVFREISRRPLSMLLSSLGIAGAVALLILGRFGWDSVSNYFEATFQREQRQDLTVTFRRPVAPRVVDELSRVPGVLRAEGVRAVPVRVRHQHRKRDSLLMAMPPNATLRQLVGHGGHETPVPESGVLMTSALARLLDLAVGDRVQLELLEGERATVEPRVAALVDEATGLQIYASERTVDDLAGDLGAISSILLKVEPGELPRVEAVLRRSPHVIDVADAVGDMRRMRDMNASFIDVWTAVSIALAASAIFGVIYNNARIALSAQSRDLASLRVLGFTRREISVVLLGNLLVQVLIAIPCGLVLGRAWAELFMMNSLDEENFRWTVAVEPRTYLLASAVAVCAAAASALWVRASLDRLDLIAVLKTRE